MAIDETSLSNGDLYTIVTNRDKHGRERSLVAIIRGTKSETVIEALRHIPQKQLETVKEVTLDLSDSMRKIVRSCFTNASRVIDRFHIQKLACDAVQEIRIKLRWDAIQEANDEMEEAKYKGVTYIPHRYENGDSKKELLAKADICYSSRQINEPHPRNSEQRFFSQNIPNWKKRMDYLIH